MTAEDVRWSFERAIAAGGFPAVQMAAGSLTDAKQFTAVDDHTFKITFDKANKLSLPDLAVPVPCVVNKKLALQHATSADPYAMSGPSATTRAAAPSRCRAGSPATS